MTATDKLTKITVTDTDHSHRGLPKREGVPATEDVLPATTFSDRKQIRKFPEQVVPLAEVEVFTINTTTHLCSATTKGKRIRSRKL